MQMHPSSSTKHFLTLMSIIYFGLEAPLINPSANLISYIFAYTDLRDECLPEFLDYLNQRNIFSGIPLKNRAYTPTQQIK